MFGPESDSEEGRELMVEIPTLGQIADAWNPELTAARIAEIQARTAAAMAALDAGESVALAEFLEQTPGEELDDLLRGK